MLMKDRVEVVLKKPSEKDGRKSFSILKKTIKPDGAARYERVAPDGLEAINASFKAGHQDLEASTIQVREIIARLYKAEGRFEKGVVHHSENLAILDRYWKHEYGDRNLVDEDAAYNELRRAVEAVGNFSLNSASKEELQAEVNSRFSGNKQRRRAAKLNLLLKFIGRNIKPRRAKKEFHTVRYLTPEEFATVLPHIKDEPFKALRSIAFTSGMRAGEIFALNESD